MRKKTLAAHVAKSLNDKKYELTETGIYVPSIGKFAGEYFHSINDEDEQVDPNLLPDQFLNFAVNVCFSTLAKINTWYLAPFAGSVTPAANWTAASFAGTASEIVSSSEGYTETYRQTFVTTAASGNAIDNLTGGKAAFTIVTASQLTITGAGLLSAQNKGATTGVLASATKFTNSRILSNGDVFQLGYRVTFNAT